MAVILPDRAAAGCRWHWIESAGARRCARDRDPDPAAAAPARRPLAGLPGLLRAPGGELLDHHRPAHQRGLRLHLDADQRAARRAADPHRRWRSTSRGRPSASQEYAEYKAKRNKTPEEFSSQLPLINEVLDALRIRHLAKEGYEADDIIATLVTEALAEGMEVLILTGDRDSLQLVTEHSTVLYPMRGVSELARMTPDAVEEQVRRAAPALPRARGDRGRDLRQPARRARGRAGLRRPLDQRVRRSRQRDHPRRQDHRQEGRGAARAPRRRASATAGSTRWCATSTSSWRRPTSRPSRGTAHLVHTLFDSLEFRVLRERLLESWDVQDAAQSTTPASSLDGARLGAGEVAAWLDEHAGPEVRTGVTVQGAWGAGTGEVRGLALAAADGQAAWIDATEVTPEDDAALMSWLGDPDARQGAPRREGPDARPGGARLAAPRAGQRHRPRGLPRPPRPALLRPGRPDPALPQARAQAGLDRRRPAQPRRARGRR